MNNSEASAVNTLLTYMLGARRYQCGDPLQRPKACFGISPWREKNFRWLRVCGHYYNIANDN